MSEIILSKSGSQDPKTKAHAQITPIKSLYWLPVSYVIGFQVLVNVFKILHGSAPVLIHSADSHELLLATQWCCISCLLNASSDLLTWLFQLLLQITVNKGKPWWHDKNMYLLPSNQYRGTLGTNYYSFELTGLVKLCIDSKYCILIHTHTNTLTAPVMTYGRVIVMEGRNVVKTIKPIKLQDERLNMYDWHCKY